MRPPILIIEDDLSVRETFRELIEAEGHRVLMAKNGRAALTVLAEESTPPCAIFLDLDMPVMNGREFLATIQREGIATGIPVVAFTASRQKDEILPGVVQWVRKPVDLVKLIGIIEQFCP